MEAIMEQLKLRRVAGSAVAQAVVESELPLPLEHPQAQQVLHSQGEITILSTELVEANVMLEGALSVQVVCVAPDGEPFAFLSRSNFKHNIAVEGAQAGMRANVGADLQTLEVNRGNEGFLHLDAVIDLYARVSSGEPVEVFAGVKGVNDIQTLTEPVAMAAKNSMGAASLRVREEVPAKNVEKVILAQGDVALKEVTMEQSEAVVEGVLNVTALYSDAEGKLNTWSQQVPFGEMVACDANAGQVQAEAQVAQLLVRPLGENFDAVSVEALVDVELSKIENAEVAPIVDAYSPSVPFEVKSERLHALQEFPCQQKKIALKESVAVPEGKPAVGRVCYVCARGVITGNTVHGGTLSLEGLLFTRIVYEAQEGGLASFTEDIPFSAEMEVPQAATDADVKLCVTATASGSGTMVEVNYSVRITANPYAVADTTVVTGVEAAEAPPQPKGIIVYFAGANETMWEVSKHFRVTKEALLAQNPGLGESLEEGQKLLLFPKRVS